MTRADETVGPRRSSPGPPRRRGAGRSLRTVVAGFLVLAASNAVGFYGLAVYLGSLEASGAFSLGLVSSLTSVFFVMSGLTGLLVSRALPVVGVRTVVIVGAAATGGGVWLIGHSSLPWQLLTGYVLLGVAMAATGPIALTTALIDAVVDPARRNQAMAVMLSGMTAGGAVVVPILADAVERDGLAAVTQVAAPLAASAIALPALVLQGRGAASAPAGADGRRGRAVTVRPGPQRARRQRARTHRPAEGEAGLVGWGSPRARRIFVLVCAIFVSFLGVQVGFNTQLYTIATELGIAGAGGALGVVAGVGMIARLVGIALVRVVPPEHFLAGMALSQCASALVLVLVPDRLGLYVCAALLGMAVGNASVLSPVLTLRVFGRSHFSVLLSRLSFVMTLGIASGPALAGVVRSATGSYVPVLLAVAVVSFAVVGMCAVLARRAGASG